MPARTAAAAVLLFALTTGCTQVTGGTVAMTTEPGPPLTTTTTPRSAPDLTLPRIPRPTNTRTPEVPAPPNAMTMTCDEYNELDDATQFAVVHAHITEGDNPMAYLGAEVTKSFLDTMCSFLGDVPLSEVIGLG